MSHCNECVQHKAYSTTNSTKHDSQKNAMKPKLARVSVFLFKKLVIRRMTTWWNQVNVILVVLSCCACVRSFFVSNQTLILLVHSLLWVLWHGLVASDKKLIVQTRGGAPDGQTAKTMLACSPDWRVTHTSSMAADQHQQLVTTATLAAAVPESAR